MSFRLSDEQLRQYEADGFVIVPNLLDGEEVELLRKIARGDHELAQSAYGREDAKGTAVKLSMHNDVPDDIYGAVVRAHRVVDNMEKLLGGEVYHYHHKMILKEPFVGGAWEWHQDYGYWYNNGCLFPLMASCMIALDRATKANGCLQVIKGTHLLGRIDHGKVGDQTGADPERIAAILERMPLVHCELEAGSAIFFHSNLLHRSDQNTSPDPRWALICCYNAARNDPYKDSRHPRYSKLEKWPDEKIKEVGKQQWQEMQRRLEQAGATV
ncbi:MAG: phytanoyl-CoA dioxygenase family protein [Gemmataceae bacterium]